MHATPKDNSAPKDPVTGPLKTELSKAPSTKHRRRGKGVPTIEEEDSPPKPEPSELNKSQLLRDDQEDLPEHMLLPDAPFVFAAKDVQTPELTLEQRSHLVAVLEGYKPVFSGKLGVPRPKFDKFHILVTSDKPLTAPAYRACRMEREKVKEQIEKMEQDGVIRKSRSPWSSPW